MDINTGMIAAGLAVGMLVGATGRGAGSLMTPILITVFGIPPTTAVGSDLIYAAITKTFGAARHHQLKNVNTELGLWMGAGSVPAAILGVFTLYEIFPRIGIDVNSVLLNLIGIIPGILIGSHFTNRAPERMLRGAIAVVLAASGLKTLDAAPYWYVIGAAVILVVAAVYMAKGVKAPKPASTAAPSSTPAELQQT